MHYFVYLITHSRKYTEVCEIEFDVYVYTVFIRTHLIHLLNVMAQTVCKLILNYLFE